MKTRIVSQTPEEKLGQSELRGKILTSLEDNVGFTVSHVNLSQKDQGHLVPLHDGHNHIYYCIQGKCFITLEDDEKTTFTLTGDTLLALSSSTKARFQVQESCTCMAVVSVPALLDIQPDPYFLGLKSILGTDREVDFKRGYSRRFLREADGFNITITNTMPSANVPCPMHYRNHIEANFFIRGRGIYSWNNETESLEFDVHDPVKKDGILYLLDEHDPHSLLITEENSQIMCVFFPALRGDEVHNFEDSSQKSSY
ncbi:uncharacterized protein LOC116291205 [Actinia tenebrosa]|uniref:L-ectoine synthase n=1 Tax=Actinia tenebrosa TaxID=6105 RepID=A0A6P8HNF3_ACTTE|nr:uncharacterized protein LOC116291205 [Actinia tenebrosa]